MPGGHGDQGGPTAWVSMQLSCEAADGELERSVGMAQGLRLEMPH